MYKAGKIYHHLALADLESIPCRETYKLYSSTHRHFMKQDKPLCDFSMDIEVSLAIDFSRSNLDPKLPDSLHHHSAQKPSPYARAIQSVLPVVQDYSKWVLPILGWKSDHIVQLTKISSTDSYLLFLCCRTKSVAAFGFGAKKKDDDKLLSLFPLVSDVSRRVPPIASQYVFTWRANSKDFLHIFA